MLTSEDQKDIQGILLSAYGGLPHAAYLLLGIDSARIDSTRRWLGRLEITPGGQKRGDSVLNRNLALTYSGLEKLGLAQSALAAFQRPFIEGMAAPHRSRILGDVKENSPDNWDWGGPGKPVVDMMLLIFAETETGLKDEVAKQREEISKAGVELILELDGKIRDDNKEHFGFRDGMSQPIIKEIPRRISNDSPEDEVSAGEFIIGYPDNAGYIHNPVKIGDGAAGLDFGRNGSYMVFRQIAQHVARFWGFLDKCTMRSDGESDPESRTALAAKFVGRWPSGAPLVGSPAEDNEELGVENNFGYSSKDPHGFVCPIGSHIRRANPRDSFGVSAKRKNVSSPEDDLSGNERKMAQAAKRSVNRHRLLRRGRPYGPDMEDKDRLVDDNKDRGLQFMCFNGDIERQFEFVQQTWINNPVFNGLNGEVDPLVGVNPYRIDQEKDEKEWNRNFMTIQEEPIRLRVHNIPRFITIKGGAYFFLPGISAFKYLTKQDQPAADRQPSYPASLRANMSQPEFNPEEAKAVSEIIEIAKELIKINGGLTGDGRGRYAPRDQHPKSHGCVAAEIIVDNLPDDLRYGIFKDRRTYPAWIRFSNSSIVMKEDEKSDIRGMAIKVLGVKGDKILEERKSDETQDFIFISADRFFLRNIRDTVEFSRAVLAVQKVPPWPLLEKPLKILAFISHFGLSLSQARQMFNVWRDSAKAVSDPLSIRYWSTTPYRLGPHAIKFAVSPHCESSAPTDTNSPRSPNYLREAMAKRLAESEARFDFLVQVQADPQGMPIENPTVAWDAPFRKVATILIPKQIFDTRERRDFDESLSFNPWHSLPEHEPLGEINRVRRLVYKESSDLRHKLNGQVSREPTEEEFQRLFGVGE